MIQNKVALKVIKMFDSTDKEETDNNEVKEPYLKKKKVDNLYKSSLVHSSLEYTSIRAPPLVAYKSIDSYCENNRGQSSVHTPSTSGLRDLESVSSPIVFKTLKEQPVKRRLNDEAAMPYILFTVEELSLVKSLKNWFNTKVCAVGQISLDASTQKCYLNSVNEVGQWSVLLDTSIVEDIPKLQQLLQIYGTLMLNNVEPCVKVCFTRNLSWVHLSLFHDSYRLMQKHIGTIDCVDSGTGDQSGVKCPQKTVDFEMNDTLDDCSILL